MHCFFGIKNTKDHKTFSNFLLKIDNNVIVQFSKDKEQNRQG